MAIFSIGPLLGPIIGPVAGGFLADAEGWRWIFWVLAIAIAVLAIGMAIFMRETYAPVLLERKAARLRKETGNPLLRSKLDTGLSPRDLFVHSIVRPCKLLMFDPISIIFALYLGVVYGYLYLMFTSITQVFTLSYGFSASNVGLVFLGLGVGSMIGVVFFSVTSDRYIKKRAAEAEVKAAETGIPSEGMKPDHVFIGIAILIIMLSLQMYLVDAYTIYAASALAANTVVRSTAGAVLPLAGLEMYEKLGIGWGNSLLGFVSLALVPVPFLIKKYGETLRKKYQPKL
ncbi:unnamed protein product [Parascedosporium putredinis]|uniref:Major facilitator superfamily (MFS) profile domain-containing protein n=1 Tax=Parascedosporium putredinis TaxID=1442378 RepID=A0A9P1HBM6_9PEZI|nr:unnamed protein product [Parascedosporium putredinis]CAI8003394.1 unnamed protein product [Parascedosporium putredinis]